MEHAFIAGIESWGAGGHMMDIITLTDGQVLVVLDEYVILYRDREAFATGTDPRTLPRVEHGATR